MIYRSDKMACSLYQIEQQKPLYKMKIKKKLDIKGDHYLRYEWEKNDKETNQNPPINYPRTG